MKTEIFYFSGTGNTFYAAKTIAENMKQGKLVPIAKIFGSEYKISLECKRVGFLFPLYYLSMPEIVMRFIENLEIPDDIYVFTVITRGFPPMGGAIKHLKDILKKKGIKLDFGSYLDMPSNDLILFGTFKDKKKKKMLQESKKELKNIMNKVNHNEEYIAMEPFSFLRKIRHSSFLKRLKDTDLHYWVKDTCNGCGICQKICPVENIYLNDNLPVWKCSQTCQECEGCINYCPSKSIEYSNKTIKQERYHHPEISAKIKINQNIIEIN